MALNQTKGMYQTLKAYFTMVENELGHMDNFGPYPYASVFGGEVCKFAYYIAATDDRLDERERVYINEITGYAESTQSMIDMMKQSGVVMDEDRERFAQTPFKCLEIALLADSVYKDRGQESDLLKMTLTFFILLGTDLMSVDGQVTSEEQAALQAIVDTMQIVAEKAYNDNEEEEPEKNNEDDEAAEEPLEEETEKIPEEAAEIEEEEQEQELEPENSLDEKQTDEYTQDVLSMSVEDIVAEVNDIEKSTDISKGLELSIGENGASYIALNLPADKRTLICSELADKDVPVLFVGNTICASYDNHIVKKHLLNGECTTKDIAIEVVKSINYSISASAKANSMKIEENEELIEALNCILDISNDLELINNVNDYLEAKKSYLKIVQNEEGEYVVRDANQINHSIEEVLWILSF